MQTAWNVGRRFFFKADKNSKITEDWKDLVGIESNNCMYFNFPDCFSEITMSNIHHYDPVFWRKS